MAPKKSVRFEFSEVDKVNKDGRQDKVLSRRDRDKENKQNKDIGIELDITGVGSGFGSRSTRDPLVSRTRFQNRSSPPPPPFCSSGRGTKQLTKALGLLEQREPREQLPGAVGSEHVMCYEPLCFAKVTSRQHDSIFIQPMRRSTADPTLLIYANKVITTKNSTQLDPVELKPEFHGWRVPDGSAVKAFLKMLTEESNSKLMCVFPLSGNAAQSGGHSLGSDAVSLDSSTTDYDENSSNASSSVFPLLSVSCAPGNAAEMPASGYGNAMLTMAMREKSVCSMHNAKSAAAGYASSYHTAGLVEAPVAVRLGDFPHASGGGGSSSMSGNGINGISSAHSSNPSASMATMPSAQEPVQCPSSSSSSSTGEAPLLLPGAAQTLTTSRGTVLDVHDAVRPSAAAAHTYAGKMTTAMQQQLPSPSSSATNACARSSGFPTPTPTNNTNTYVSTAAAAAGVGSPIVTLTSGMPWHTISSSSSSSGTGRSSANTSVEKKHANLTAGSATTAGAEGGAPPGTDTPVDRRPLSLHGPLLPRRRTAAASTLFARSRYVPLPGSSGGSAGSAGGDGVALQGMASAIESPLLEYPDPAARNSSSGREGTTNGLVAVALSADMASHLRTQGGAGEGEDKDKGAGAGAGMGIYQLATSQVYEKQRQALASASSGRAGRLSGGWPSSFSDCSSASTASTALYSHGSSGSSSSEASHTSKTHGAGGASVSAAGPLSGANAVMSHALISAAMCPPAPAPAAAAAAETAGSHHKTGFAYEEKEKKEEEKKKRVGDANDSEEEGEGEGEGSLAGEPHSPSFSEMQCDTSDSDSDSDLDDLGNVANNSNDDNDNEAPAAAASAAAVDEDAAEDGEEGSVNMSSSSVDADISRGDDDEDEEQEEKESNDTSTISAIHESVEPEPVAWDASRETSCDGWPASPLAQLTPDVGELGSNAYGRSTLLNALMNPVQHHQLSDISDLDDSFTGQGNGNGGVALRIRGGMRGTWELQDYVDVSPSLHNSSSGLNSNSNSSGSNPLLGAQCVGAALASCSPSPRAAPMYGGAYRGGMQQQQQQRGSGLPPLRARTDSAGSLLSTEGGAEADTYRIPDSAASATAAHNASYDADYADTSIDNSFSDGTDLDLSTDSALELLGGGEGQEGQEECSERDDDGAGEGEGDDLDEADLVSPSVSKHSTRNGKRGGPGSVSKSSTGHARNGGSSSSFSSRGSRGIGIALSGSSKTRKRSREPSPASSIGATDMETDETEGSDYRDCDRNVSDNGSKEALFARNLRDSSSNKLPMLPPPAAAATGTASTGKGSAVPPRSMPSRRGTQQQQKKRSLRGRAAAPVHRDAVFGTWPTRHQSASTGSWRN